MDETRIKAIAKSLRRNVQLENGVTFVGLLDAKQTSERERKFGYSGSSVRKGRYYFFFQHIELKKWVAFDFIPGAPYPEIIDKMAASFAQSIGAASGHDELTK